MNYPTPQDVEQMPKKAKAALLNQFRADIESMAQIIVDHFFDDESKNVAQNVVQNLIQARMWSGNLFSSLDVKDLNRERDEKEGMKEINRKIDEEEAEDEAGDEPCDCGDCDNSVEPESDDDVVQNKERDA